MTEVIASLLGRRWCIFVGTGSELYGQWWYLFFNRKLMVFSQMTLQNTSTLTIIFSFCCANQGELTISLKVLKEYTDYTVEKGVTFKSGAKYLYILVLLSPSIRTDNMMNCHFYFKLSLLPFICKWASKWPVFNTWTINCLLLFA